MTAKRINAHLGGQMTINDSETESTGENKMWRSAQLRMDGFSEVTCLLISGNTTVGNSSRLTAVQGQGAAKDQKSPHPKAPSH